MAQMKDMLRSLPAGETITIKNGTMVSSYDLNGIEKKLRARLDRVGSDFEV